MAFANDVLPGTLGATLLVDPATAKAHAAALDTAMRDLRYGSIGINVWCAVAFLLGYTPWGAYPGHTEEDDRERGSGFVHNAFLLQHVQKSVAWMPFRPAPRAMLKGELTMSAEAAVLRDQQTGARRRRAAVRVPRDRQPCRPRRHLRLRPARLTVYAGSTQPSAVSSTSRR